jgi:hypothetical protein
MTYGLTIIQIKSSPHKAKRNAHIRQVCYFTLNSPFFTMAQKPPLGQGLSIVKASQSHSDTPLSVGLLWTSDQPEAKTSTWQHTTHNRQISMSTERYEPAIPASVRPQTNVVDHAASSKYLRYNWILEDVGSVWIKLCAAGENYLLNLFVFQSNPRFAVCVNESLGKEKHIRKETLA